MIRIIIVTAIMAVGCSTKKDNNSRLVDSTVVGKDTTSMDVRRDIDLSDENKRVLPDEATEPTKSDEASKEKESSEKNNKK